jgi:hypothetical protein
MVGTATSPDGRLGAAWDHLRTAIDTDRIAGAGGRCRPVPSGCGTRPKCRWCPLSCHGPATHSERAGNGDQHDYCEAHAHRRRKTIRLPLVRRLRPGERPNPPTRLPQRPLGPPSPGGSLSPEMAQHALQSGGVPAHHVDSRSSTTRCPCTSVPTHSELSSRQWRATSTDYDRRMTSPHVGFGDQLADALRDGRRTVFARAAAGQSCQDRVCRRASGGTLQPVTCSEGLPY